MTNGQIVKLGIEYAEELCGMVKDRGKREPCHMCKGMGSKAGPPDWRLVDCPICKGTGFTWENPIE